MFSNVYAYASAIRNGSNPDPRNVTHCAYCREPTDPYNVLQCSACHCIRYCSRNCQRLAWKGSQGGYFGYPHKIECGQIKVFAAEKTKVLGVVKQFPWTRIDGDGGTSYELALAMCNLLGKGPKFGWWAMEERDPNLTLKKLISTTGRARPPTLAWGSILLSDKHFDEKSGWKLPEEEIPWLSFDQGRAAPSFPPVFEHNWTSYYKWRGLPLKSIAVLLLHWPLSIYRLLYLLGFVPSKTDGGERRKLNIHCLGIEAELNALPVFGELALLLPNTDIDIVMFGKCPYDIARQAKPHALAAQKYAYEYRAPDQCGSGSIRIQLYKKSPIWDPVEILPQKMIPDVIIGLNTGLSTYVETWGPVFSTSRALSIPFALTEFSRLSLLEDVTNYRAFAEEAKKDKKLSELLGQEKLQVLANSLDYDPPSTINPFMRPGHLAAQSNSMPSAVNGFSCIITPLLNIG